MKYKVGDKVRVKEWEWLKKEYRLSESSVLPPKGQTITFTRWMKEYCGRVVTIKEVQHDYYIIKEDKGDYQWQDWMFSDYGFTYGEEIEVSDDGNFWRKGIYVGYIEGAKFCYAALTEKIDIEDFNKGVRFYFYIWKYARPIQIKKALIQEGK